MGDLSTIVQFGISGPADSPHANELIHYALKGKDMAIAIQSFQTRIHYELRKGRLEDLTEEHEAVIRSIVEEEFEKVQSVVDTIE